MIHSSRITKIMQATFAAALISLVPLAAQSAEKAVKKPAGRSIASLGNASAKDGQGALMLRSLRSTKPAFLSATRKPAAVQVGGVCRDNFGRTYYSHEPGYVGCIDNQNVQAGTGSMNGYFGPAQRQAGVGFRVQ